jgi:hypothetical protein
MNRKEIMRNNHEIENYSWGIIQDMIEKEVNAAFKLRQLTTITMPTKKEIKQIIKKTVREQRKNNETETIIEKLETISERS